MSDETMLATIERWRNAAQSNIAWMRDHLHDAAEADEATALAEAYDECATELRAHYERLAALAEEIGVDSVGREPTERSLLEYYEEKLLARLGVLEEGK